MPGFKRADSDSRRIALAFDISIKDITASVNSCVRSREGSEGSSMGEVIAIFQEKGGGRPCSVAVS